VANSFLGSGWQFPIRVNGRGSLSYSTGERDIAEAIWLILSTSPGERIMRPEFGCGIHDYVFAPDNAQTRGAIAYAVQASLLRWEPRIDVLDVRIETHPESANTLLIYVDYQIRANNTFHNIVYPFYITEGKEAGAGRHG
jgi:uncharacterized protein